MSEVQKSEISIPKMDCVSEEKLVKMALRPLTQVMRIDVDLLGRSISVYHTGSASDILFALKPLNLGSELTSTYTQDLDTVNVGKSSPADEAKILKILLGINFSMFLIEIVMGWIAQSTGLIADSLDMLADASVYGISLYAVGKAVAYEKRAARISGFLQIVLAFGALSEVIRRFFIGSEPNSILMMGVSALALSANVSSLFLLAKHRKGKVHMRASWIFSTNDVVVNFGVILAGVLVAFTNSPYPDLIIGLLITTIVLRGAYSILKISR